MNKNIERILQSPMMKLASEHQARLDSLSYATGSIADLSKIVRDLDPAKRWAGHAMTQDLLSQLTQSFPQNNLAISNATLEMAKSLAELSNSNTSLFESIKLNTALINALEATHLGLKPATQFILPEGFASKNQIGDLSSVISKATEVLKQYEQFGELESLKAISSLKNFPFKDLVQNNFDYSTELKESSDKAILELDLEISERLSIVDDFNDFSIEEQNFLLSSFRTYYYPIILNFLITFLCLKDLLYEELDLSNNIFIFVESTKATLSYVGNNIYQPNPYAIIDSIIGGALLMLIVKIFENKK